jgi:hypothetical protein
MPSMSEMDRFYEPDNDPRLFFLENLFCKYCLS